MNDTDNNKVIVLCKKLSKTYSHGKVKVDAIQSVDLAVKQGEMIAIYGPSGSGKSTLLNIIGQLDQQSTGDIELFGQSVASLNAKEKTLLRREKLGFIFQNFNLLPVLSAVENVELALASHPFTKKERREKALNMLKKVGLQDRSNHYPHELSGGQQQRVGIARALVHEPQLVMADEPTANLDSQSAEDIINTMHLLAKEQQVSFIFSTHDNRILAAVDRNLQLSDGRAIA